MTGNPPQDGLALPDLSPIGRFEWERALRGWHLPPSTKLVGLVLATYANQDGSSIRPTQAQVARDTGLGVRAVRKHLAVLRDDLSVIERTHRGSSSGRVNYADVYRLVVPDDLFDRLSLVPNELDVT